MNLTDLEPSFLTVIEPGKTRQHHDDLSQAQGIFFLCPACFQSNGGAVGTHGVVCWFRDRGVPDVEEPRPARWQLSGSGYEDLTLHPSIAITSGCRWHGWIEKGEVR